MKDIRATTLNNSIINSIINPMLPIKLPMINVFMFYLITKL